MKTTTIFLGLAVATIGVFGLVLSQGKKKEEGKNVTYNKLTPEEERVIVHKGTEMPFTGKYYDSRDKGTYTCKRCGAALYRSEDKFDSHCGWPSFDDAIPGAVNQVPDADGMRTEILCVKCGAHLGHVFTGEGFTPKDTRFCVNSISMNFIPTGAGLSKPEAKTATQTQKAYFAGGCFWGTEYYLKQAKGVTGVKVGYMGGTTKNPTYKQVCSGTTGHIETNEVAFDPAKTTYEEVAKLFFEIHDPTQVGRQGPDIGEQYKSVVFYADDEQKKTAEKLIGLLKSKGFKVATELRVAKEFWPAEDYHQDYYAKTGKEPYCHNRVKRF